jgi:hypothetical protein
MTAVVEGVADTRLRWVRLPVWLLGWCMVRLCVMMAVQYYDVMSMSVERAMKLL